MPTTQPGDLVAADVVTGPAGRLPKRVGPIDPVVRSPQPTRTGIITPSRNAAATAAGPSPRSTSTGRPAIVCRSARPRSRRGADRWIRRSSLWAVELRREESRRRTENLIGPAQLPDLLLEAADLGVLLRRHPRTRAASTSAWLTHLRTVSTPKPSWRATRSPHRDAHRSPRESDGPAGPPAPSAHSSTAVSSARDPVSSTITPSSFPRSGASRDPRAIHLVSADRSAVACVRPGWGGRRRGVSFMVCCAPRRRIRHLTEFRCRRRGGHARSADLTDLCLSGLRARPFRAIDAAAGSR